MKKCMNCGMLTDNPKFCNNICAATYNGKIRKFDPGKDQRTKILNCISCGDDITVNIRAGINSKCDKCRKIKKVVRKCKVCGEITCPIEKCKGSKTCKMCGVSKSNDQFNTYKSKKNLKKAGKLYSYCRTCTNKYVNDRLNVLKQSYVKEAGGECSLCGYNSCMGALEFHHKDPSLKDIQISKVTSEKALSEIKKCILLCSNCHREVHAGLKMIK
jgi:hypothetical protein